MTHAANVWNKFCQRFKVMEQSVPLFKADADGVAATTPDARTQQSPNTDALSRNGGIDPRSDSEAG